MKQLTKLLSNTICMILLLPMLVIMNPQQVEASGNISSNTNDNDDSDLTGTEPQVNQKDTIVIHNAPDTLELGQIFHLEYTIYFVNTDQYSLTSSNPSIVKVSEDSFLECISEGIVTITLKTSNNIKSFTLTVESTQVVSITVEENTRIKFGDGISISASVYPTDAEDKTLTYESSNEDIVQVDDKGHVTTTGVGEADVTITAVNEVSATVHITVYEIVPNDIRTNRDSYDIEIRDSDTISIEILPDDSNKLEYTVQILDPGIIKIDSAGNITPLKEGSTSIEITTWNNITKVIPVNVYTIPVTKVSIDDSRVNYKSKNKIDIDTTLSLSAIIFPENATYLDITWYSSDESVIRIKNNVPEVVGTGNAVLTVRAKSGVESTISFIVEKDYPIIYIVGFIILGLILVIIISVFSIKVTIKIKNNETIN